MAHNHLDRYSTLTALVAVFCLLISAPGEASQRVLVVKSGAAQVYQEVVFSILENLSSQCRDPETGCLPIEVGEATLEQQSIREILSAEFPRPALIVTFGMKAAQQLREAAPATPVLYTLIPKSASSELGLTDTSTNSSALFLDQPIRRYLRLIKQINPSRKRVGILLGPTTKSLEHTLEMFAKAEAISLFKRHVETAAEIGPALKEILDEAELLLALPDPLIYNRKTVFNILLSSYHNQIPVIGFSASYVRAGAMIAVYSSPADIGLHIAETIEEFFTLRDGRLPHPEHPRYFSVAINENVAQSLNIRLQGKNELQEILRRSEGQ